ncbi:MAG: hypothetical protein ABGZ53_31920, partial [Fuerstiella sp.]
MTACVVRAPAAVNPAKRLRTALDTRLQNPALDTVGSNGLLSVNRRRHLRTRGQNIVHGDRNDVPSLFLMKNECRRCIRQSRKLIVLSD